MNNEEKRQEVIEEKVVNVIPPEFAFNINDKPETYTLNCCGNLERKKQHQMRVTLQPLSQDESDQATAEAIRKSGDKNNVNYEEWQRKYLSNYVKEQFRAKIVKLENVFFNIDGEIKEIKNPLDLYGIKSNQAMSIISEITKLSNSQDEISEDEEKKSV